ncbi:hypothetical protein D9613_006330 [Agrocybe pediades]|uniref:Uncharacterized protein n=1 Tax=Agrocybe pediades TaxID=84607 RepID=A0A8H4VNV8_9AGAR|nr:hypothetical protein D9613_006330 [Agrocybe pediades]
MSTQITRIDDQDPAIVYSANDWTLGGNGNEYMSTTMRTITLGASIRLSFTGTQITVFGSIGPSSIYGEAPTSLFSIDNGRAQQFDPAGTQSADEGLYNQRFFQSPVLSPGRHTLVVTISDVPSLKSSFIVDYLDIVGGGPVPPGAGSSSASSLSSFSSSTPAPTPPKTIESSSSSSSSTSSTATTTSTTISGSSSHTDSGKSSSDTSITFNTVFSSDGPAANGGGSSTLTAGVPNESLGFQSDRSTNASRSTNHTRAIVGAVVGCILLILLVLLGLWFFLKKRRVKIESEKAESRINEFPPPISQDYNSMLATGTVTSPSQSQSPWSDYSVSNSHASSGTATAFGSSVQAQARPSKLEEALREREEEPPSYDALH